MSEIEGAGQNQGRRRRRVRPVLVERVRERLQEGPEENLLGDLTREIAAAITDNRLRLNLSQAELAQLCGTTQSAIARVEAGRGPPRIDTLQRIANALDCSLRVELTPRTRSTRSAR